MKIAHIADTHIKNLRYHEDYKIAFKEMFSVLQNEKPDYIVHCGDIAHTKTQISPEFVEMTGWFLKTLSGIAPTYVILGNHDGNLKNKSRQDAITPIVDALGLSDLHLLKGSGEAEAGNNLVFNVLSIFDREGWTKPTNKEKINIALYHGAISGCKTDLLYTITEGQDSIDIFKDFDFAMLGDIHKQQKLDKEGRVWYAGSTIQQNQGEKDDKGFLIWEIEDKNTWSVRNVVVKNPSPFISIRLDSNGDFDGLLAKNARVRLIDENSQPRDVINKAISKAKLNGCKTISFVSQKFEKTLSRIQDTKLDFRDHAVQQELLKNFLEEKGLDEEKIKQIFVINSDVNNLTQEDKLARNVSWSIKSFTWEGLFNYYEQSTLNFDNYRGLIGIFGKNFTGKSSIIDSMLFTIFGTTSKKEKKLINVINNDKKSAFGEIKIESGGKLFTIRRELKKVKKKGEDNATSSVDFYYEIEGEKHSLNDTTKIKTDKVIQNYFGSYEDFSLSSLATQNESFNFINEGLTRRKEIIANFLDLSHFDNKVKVAKEEYNQTKALIKKLSTKELTQQQSEISEKLITLNHKFLNLEEGTRYSLSKEQIEMYKNIGSLQKQLEIVKQEQEELDGLLKSADLYEHYISAISTNGIPYKIIQEKIPFINQEIYDYLVGIVDFEIFFECSGNNLEIFIKHPEQEARPIEMASGAEKTMASIAIRLALTSVSSIPKVDFFMLDEPGTALDEDNLNGFISILELIKENFNTTLLISHLPGLKDCVDKEIQINKTNKGAKIL